MTDCNATLTTATVEPCPNEGCGAADGVMHFWTDGGQKHVTLHTMTCKRSRGCPTGQHPRWTDDWDGATPHVEPVAGVTDAELDAAWDLALASEVLKPAVGKRGGLLPLLQAAAKARQATEGNNP
jgi:hypothetical protein